MKFRKSQLAVAVSGALAMSGAAYAQGVLEEITVTAQKREESLSDIGLSVTAFTGDTMQQLGMEQPIDIAAQTPGLVIANNMGDSQPAVMIRGIGIADFNTSTNPGVAVYVDEVARPIPAMLGFALYDMDRVEILKGPQGTLYGQNTTGGAVSFITKQPTDELDGYVSADFGSFDRTNIEGAIGGSLGEGFRVRVSALKTKQDEGIQRDVFTGDDHGKKDRTAARIQLSADLGDRADATFRYSYGKEDSESQAPRVSTGLDVLQYYYYTTYAGSQSDIGPYDILLGDNEALLDNEMDSFSLTINADVGPGSLTSVTGYDDVSHLNVSPFGGTELPVQNARYGGKLENLSQELRYTSKEADFVNWIVGLYYSDIEQKNSSELDLGAGLGYYFLYFAPIAQFGAPFANNPFPSVLDTRVSQQLTTTAAFAHTEWFLTDRLTFTAAARFARDELEYDVAMISDTPACDGALCDVVDYYYGLTDYDSAFGTFFNLLDGGAADGVRQNAVIAGSSGSKDNSYVTWRAGLDFAATENVLIYANVSEGTKAHGVYGGIGIANAAFQPYRPENVLAFEAGIKTNSSDGTLSFNAALFNYDYEDQQVIVSFDPGLGLPNDILTNIAQSDISGLEADLTWAPLDGLTARVTATWLDTEITDASISSTLAIFPGAEPTTGVPLGFSPELSYSVLVRYDFSIGNDGGAYVQFDGDHSDDFLAGPGRVDLNAASRTLYNARVGYVRDFTNGSLEVALWGKNLGDETYRTYAFTTNPGVQQEHVGMPRTYGINLRYTFN